MQNKYGVKGFTQITEKKHFLTYLLPLSHAESFRFHLEQDGLG